MSKTKIKGRINRSISFDTEVYFKIEEMARKNDRTFSGMLNRLLKKLFEGDKK
jgi:predicted CopG family antitoxin